MRQFPLGLDKNIQVVAEAFNLLNRTDQTDFLYQP